MVKWKFKTFILLYMAILIGIVVFACTYVWNGLKDYQSTYDREIEKADPIVVIEEFMQAFDLEYLSKVVREDSAIYTTDYEDIEQVVQLYLQDYSDCEFTYMENEEYRSKEQRVYTIYADERMLLTVIMRISEVTSEFGFYSWKVRDVILDKYYEADKSIVLKVPEDAKVTINGIELSASDKSITEADETYDDEFAQVVIKYTGKYEKYIYYKINKLYTEPEVVVNHEGQVLTAQRLSNGTYSYEDIEDSAFVAEIQPIVIDTETIFANCVAKFEDFELLDSYLLSGAEIYTVVKSAKDFVQYVVSPRNVTYENWKISSIKRYGENIFTCDVYYLQTVTYPGREREYENTIGVLFVKRDGVWKLAYQKNK